MPTIFFLTFMACTEQTSKNEPTPDSLGETQTETQTATNTGTALEGNYVSRFVGYAGGTVEHPDGATVVIPEGALSEDVEISIRLLSDDEIPSMIEEDLAEGEEQLEVKTPVFEFLPHGTVFSEPVTVTLPITNELEDDESVALLYYDEDDETWWAWRDDEYTEGVSGWMDREAGTVSTQTRHFTVGAGYASFLGSEFILQAGKHTVSVRRLEKCTGFINSRKARAGGASSVKGIIVHSTAGSPHTPNREVRTALAACVVGQGSATAHYVIGRDGVIVELYDPATVNVAHILAWQSGCFDSTKPKLRDITIGIELVNSSPGATAASYNDFQRYPAAQMAALVRLTNYLMEKFDLPPPTMPRELNSKTGPGILMDTWEAHDGMQSVLTHKEIDGCRTYSEDPARQAKAHVDPAGDWQSDAFFYAIAQQAPGEINVAGGDAFGQHAPGNGGAIDFEQNASFPVLSSLDKYQNDDPTSSQALVHESGTLELASGTNLWHDFVVKGGEVVLNGDHTLWVFGTFYVGPDARIRSKSGSPPANLTVHTNGLAVIAGRIDLSGDDGYIPKYPTLFGEDLSACAYEVYEDIEGAGSQGGTFTLRALYGPLVVPTLVTLGGDAHFYDPEQVQYTGGDGGDIRVKAEEHGVLFHGTTPHPGTFTQGFRASTYYGSGCDGAFDMIWNSAIQANTVKITRGALTSGGSGATSVHDGVNADLLGYGTPGGNGGHVDIEASLDSLIFKNWEIWTGLGYNLIYRESDHYGTVMPFAIWQGGAGASGAAGFGSYGGDGAQGGNAGNVTIDGYNEFVGDPSGQNLFGWDNEAPADVFYGFPGKVAGPQWYYSDGTNLLLTISAAGGTGGPPGGSAVSYPGNFGEIGQQGTITIAE